MAYTSHHHWPLLRRDSPRERERPSNFVQLLGSCGVVVGGALVVASAALHVYLWSAVDGYRHIATIGPLFLVQGITGCALGSAVIATRHLALSAAGAAFMAASIGGLAVSVWFGLFGYHERMSAPYAGLALGVELAGLVALLTGVATEAVRQRRSLP